MKRFQTGKIVSGEFFKGREKIVSEVETLISMDQSVVLIAPRRYGKSSIIQKIIDDKGHLYKTISIDLMEVHNKRLLAELIISRTYQAIGLNGVLGQLKEGTLEVLSQIINYLASLKLTMNDVSLQFTEKLIKDKDDDRLLKHALELPGIVSEKLNIKFLFAIDEFGEIDKFQSKDELLDLMRSIFQNQNNVVFIFAGSQYALMNKIFKDKQSSFYKFAVPIQVPTMSGKEFEKLFYDVFYSNGVSIPDGFASKVEKISNGIPYYMIRIAQQVLVDAKVGGVLNTYCFSIKRAALEVYSREESYFSLELNKLRGKRYDTIALSAIATGDSFSSELAKYGVARQNANTIVNSLMFMGFIDRTGAGSYKIIDPFLRRYIKKLGQ